MNQFIISCLALVYAGYKWYDVKTKGDSAKSERILYVIVIFMALQLNGYPFWLPAEYSLSVWGFLGFAGLLYKVIRKTSEKNLLFFSIMFLALGIEFFILGLKESHMPPHRSKSFSTDRQINRAPQKPSLK